LILINYKPAGYEVEDQAVGPENQCKLDDKGRIIQEEAPR
jgi:hypothetical protein